MHLSKGTSLKFGSYVIESVLGQGGFGITYVAEQVGLGRKVAIKEFFMRELCNRDSDTSCVSVPSVGSKELVDKFRAKFVKEARMIAAMEDSHIIRIHDVFEENGTAYYVMEYLPGGSLKDNIPAGGFPESVALGYVRQIADALRYIHEEKHVLHLDVKPSNVLMRKNGELVLIDFGISKHYDDEGGYQTSSSPVGVSRGYAPLEQYNTGGVSQFSAATDVYSLGAVLYTLLTGQIPPDANMILNSGLPEFTVNVSANVKAAITAAMQPRRPDRPQTIAAFMSMLDVRGADVPPTPPTPQPQPVNPESEDTVVNEPAASVESDRGFQSEYNRMFITQKYKEALELCIRHAKNCGKARQTLPDAMRTYLEKCGKDVFIPAFTGVSYEWLTDLLISNGYKRMTMTDVLKVGNVTLEIVKQADGINVRIRNRLGFKLFAKIQGVVLIMLFCVFVATSSMSNYMGGYCSLDVYHLQFSSENTWYYQFERHWSLDPDPLWLVWASLHALVFVLCIFWIRRLRNKKFKSIRKIVSDALIKKWYEK